MADISTADLVNRISLLEQQVDGFDNKVAEKLAPLQQEIESLSGELTETRTALETAKKATDAAQAAADNAQRTANASVKGARYIQFGRVSEDTFGKEDHVAVTFAQPFPGTPTVCLTQQEAKSGFVRFITVKVSKTGFIIHNRDHPSLGCVVHWIAVG